MRFLAAAGVLTASLLVGVFPAQAAKTRHHHVKTHSHERAALTAAEMREQFLSGPFLKCKRSGLEFRGLTRFDDGTRVVFSGSSDVVFLVAADVEKGWSIRIDNKSTCDATIYAGGRKINGMDSQVIIMHQGVALDDAGASFAARLIPKGQ